MALPVALIAQLSLRNIVRHRRRNLMLLVAIAVAVFTVLIINTLIRGMQADMQELVVSNLNGHFKVHAPGYRDDPSIERGFKLAVDWAPANPSAIEGWAARVRIPAVILSERETRGVQFVGIDPAQESISFLGTAEIDGSLLSSADDRRLLIGKEMAAQLETRVGRRLVIMTQGADGLNREAGFRIVGTYDTDGTTIEKQFVFTGRNALQKMVGAHVVTEVSVRVDDDGAHRTIGEGLAAFFADLEVKTWQQLEPLTASFVLFADSAIFIYYFIVMTALIFGLVNTLVTSVMERVRELGMLRAVGMRPGTVVAQVVFESTFIMMIGVALGLAAGWLVFQALPTDIDMTSWVEGADKFGIPNIVRLRLQIGDIVLVTFLSILFGVLASLYPARKAVSISPVEAMRR